MKKVLPTSCLSFKCEAIKPTIKLVLNKAAVPVASVPFPEHPSWKPELSLGRGWVLPHPLTQSSPCPEEAFKELWRARQHLLQSIVVTLESLFRRWSSRPCNPLLGFTLAAIHLLTGSTGLTGGGDAHLGAGAIVNQKISGCDRRVTDFGLEVTRGS